MESPMIAPSEPTTITVHRASRPSLASTPPKKTTTSPGKMNPANTDASAAGSRKIKTSASHGGKPSTCSMSQLTIDTTKALRRLNPSNDGVPAAEASVFAGFIFPGEVVVFFGGVLANEGRLALWTVILVGSLGAIIGDSIGYEVGRHYGMRLLARLPARLVKPDHVARAQDLIRRKGGRAIFLGRFTAELRVLVRGLD